MKINREEYLFHVIDENEIRHMRRILDLIETTLNRHTITHTLFLKPNLIEISKSILNRFDEIKYHIYGGFTNAERKVLSIYSWCYFYDYKKDSIITGIEISCNLENIEHRDVLGSLLGLGIVREKIGDIGFFDDSIKVALFEDISNFVLYNLKKIKRENVKIRKIPLEDLGDLIIKGNEKDIISASMRLDSIVSEAYNLSRSDSQKLIRSKLVKVNFSPEEKDHKILEEGDLISVRGKGRFKILSIDGLTRKERIKLKLFYPE